MTCFGILDASEKQEQSRSQLGEGNGQRKVSKEALDRNNKQLKSLNKTLPLPQIPPPSDVSDGRRHRRVSLMKFHVLHHLLMLVVTDFTNVRVTY